VGPLREVTVSEADYSGLDSIAKKIADEKQHFERLEMTKEELLEMFAVRGNCSRWTSVGRYA